MTPILLALSTLAAAQVPTHVVTGRATELVREKHLPALMSLAADDTLFTYAPAARDAIVVADARNGRTLHELPRGDVLECHFTPDGRRLVVVRLAGKPPSPPKTLPAATAEVRDALTGRVLATIPLPDGEPAPRPERGGPHVFLGGDLLVAPHAQDARPMTFEVGDRYFFSRADSIGSVYDLRTGRRAGVLRGTAEATYFAVTPDGRTLAVVDATYSLRVFDMQTLKVRRETNFGRARVASLAISDDATRIAVGLAYDDLHFYDGDARPRSQAVTGWSIEKVRFRRPDNSLFVATDSGIGLAAGLHEWLLLLVGPAGKGRAAHVVTRRPELKWKDFDALGPVALRLVSRDGGFFLAHALGERIARVELRESPDAKPNP